MSRKRTVNFVKYYMVKNNLRNRPIGKQIVNAQGMGDPNGPYDCKFGSGTA